jgi:YVTN family beta-propeller protein
MSFRRAGLLAAAVAGIVLWVACGQVYRPVVLPCSEGGLPGCPVEAPPAPANFGAIFSISHNVANFPGGAMQIDVGGDSIIGETPSSDTSAPNLGNNPTHAAILPNHSQVFVASAGSLSPGGVDVISSFTPAIQASTATGLGTVTSIPLPTGSLPVFLNTTQNGFVYVANFGSNSVSAINAIQGAVVNTTVVGTNPVALAEIPNGLKLYVANQGSNSVSSLNTVDLSSNILTGFTGVTPVWMVARGDSQKVYVLTQGDGTLVTIDTATDTVTSSLPVGAGVNFMFYDPNLNRLYVTNPATRTVYIFSVSGGANDTPLQLAAISFASGSAPCPSGCVPASVTGLPDGSRFYVASYQTASSCPDPVVGSAAPCVIPGLTIFDANSFAVKYPSSPTLKLLTWSPPCTPSGTNQCGATGPFATNQYAVPPVTACTTAATYSPSTMRFRVFTTASTDSSRVYVGMCDAGAVAVVTTSGANTNNAGNASSPDTVVTDLPAPFSAGPIQASGEPANQNPIFLLTGQ